MDTINVVSYSFSTSNHNSFRERVAVIQLYLILFLHQTTTAVALLACIHSLYLILFLHQTTTVVWKLRTLPRLYLILFLHQTTT